MCCVRVCVLCVSERKMRERVCELDLAHVVFGPIGVVLHVVSSVPRDVVGSHPQPARRYRTLSDASARVDRRQPMRIEVLVTRAENQIVDTSAEAGMQRQVGRQQSVIKGRMST